MNCCYFLQTYNNTTHGGYVPEKGEVCSCKYSADNEWYRAVVHEIQLDAKLRVTYIDFGNGDEVLAANIRKLQSGPLTQLPAQVCLSYLISPTRTGWPLAGGKLGKF